MNFLAGFFAALTCTTLSEGHRLEAFGYAVLAAALAFIDAWWENVKK